MVTSEEIATVVKGETVPAQFMATVAEHADLTALRCRAGDEWRTWTFAEYAAAVARVAAGLARLGLEPGDRVVLMMRNRPEFHFADMAVMMCGATSISIFNSSAPEQIAYQAGHSKAVIAIADDAAFAARFATAQDQLPHLRTILAVDTGGDLPAGVLPFASLFEAGETDLRSACRIARSEDLATVIYTSGTTGPPKGVMISHFNACWTTESLRRCLDMTSFAAKRLVSYLPMAHIAERMVSHYQGAMLGYDVTTCPDPTEVAAYAREVRPNIMFGVPRVWEKIHARINAMLSADPEKKAGFDRAVAAAAPIALDMAWERAPDAQRATYQSLDEQAFAGLRSLIGLDELDSAISGAAPIPAEVLTWFRAIGVPMSEVYGLSECTGPMTFTPYRIKPGTVGPAIPGCEVRLDDDGEVCCRGGNVYTGYLDDPTKTAEMLDDDGWLHSGDVGVVDSDGYLRIVDRKKELIITAGGKNISPANLESALKVVPLVGQCATFGDNRPYVIALLVLDPEAVQAWAGKHGLQDMSLAELAQHPGVLAEIGAGVDAANARFSRVEQIKRWAVLPDEWLPDSEELTATSKLKRRGVLRKYADVINSLYS